MASRGVSGTKDGVGDEEGVLEGGDVSELELAKVDGDRTPSG